jgi:hypothetical protein
MMMNQTFLALGNKRPQIIVELEDFVLEAVISISEGRSRESAMDKLYSQLSSLEDNLVKDDEAMSWFNLATAPFFIPSTPPPSEFLIQPWAGMSI